MKTILLFLQRALGKYCLCLVWPILLEFAKLSFRALAENGVALAAQFWDIKNFSNKLGPTILYLIIIVLQNTITSNNYLQNNYALLKTRETFQLTNSAEFLHRSYCIDFRSYATRTTFSIIYPVTQPYKILQGTYVELGKFWQF